MRSPFAGSFAVALATTLIAAAAAAQTAPKGPGAWQGCCGLAPWAKAGPMTRPGGEGSNLLLGGYGSLVAGSTVRHHLGLKGDIPAPYTHLHNPLSATPQNAERGAAVYQAQCASCHGATGLGDGPASKGLTPPPAALAWLASVPPSRRDAFIYWSIAEGGAPLGTDMPAYKGKLTDEQIWSLIGYIQARLPSARTAR